MRCVCASGVASFVMGHYKGVSFLCRMCVEISRLQSFCAMLDCASSVKCSFHVASGNLKLVCGVKVCAFVAAGFEKRKIRLECIL